MAAYAALVSLLNDLELIPNHAIHSFSFDDKQLSSLSQTVEILIDFIETYNSHEEAAQVLERRIASVAHAAHDVIESHIVDQIHAGSTSCGNVRSYFLLDLQRAIDSMEVVKRKATEFKAKSGLKATYSSPSPAAAAATSSQPLKSNVIVGFDEVVVRLMDIITGEPCNQRLVVPITGMGGLGKTSLTKIVYDHSYVERHFDVRLWATISQKYSAQNILTQLLYGENESNISGDVNELGEVLHKRLYGRRYLIVLDDMWSLEAWDEVHMFLPDSGNGSCVVVTTRLSGLAAHLSSSPFKLDFLHDDMSWELFCGEVFGEEDCPVELEEIGKKIVKRCRGLPLSIVVIGGHLRRSSRSIELWEKVAKYMNPISSIGEEEQCLEILSLSYQHLPACLKPCFLYMGIFKEDEEIHASKLLLYWIGEGFIKPKKESSLEEVGEAYLKDLIDRNLILVDKRSWNGKAERCKVHDIVREMCLKICKKEKFLCVVHDPTQATCRRERRLVILEGGKLDDFDTIGAKQSAPLLRSLVRLGGFKSILNKFPSGCRLIRVVVHDKITLQGTCLSLAHLQQVNLRTLVFNRCGPECSESAYSILPLISACWNLQTFYMMKSSYDPVTLPCEIWEMPQLRHLHANGIVLTDPSHGEGSEHKNALFCKTYTHLK